MFSCVSTLLSYVDERLSQMPNVSISVPLAVLTRLQEFQAGSPDKNFSRCASSVISAGLDAVGAVAGQPKTYALTDVALRSAVRLYAEYAIAAQNNTMPRHVPWRDITRALKKAGLLDPYTGKIIGGAFRARPYAYGAPGPRPTKAKLVPGEDFKTAMDVWKQEVQRYEENRKDLAAWQAEIDAFAPPT